MTPPSDPTPDAIAPHAARTRRERRLLLLFAIFLLAFGAATWFAYPHASPLARQWLARRHLPEFRQHLEKGDLQAAAALLRDARRWASDDPEVLHASLDFNNRPGGDPRTTLSLVRRLQELGAATPADLIIMGQVHVRLGETAKAQDIYDHLPAAARQQQHGLELHAVLLQAAGQGTAAAEARRAALQSAPHDPDSLQKLATLDLNSSDPGRRSAMRARLWQVARTTTGPTALAAIENLSLTKELTVPQLGELLRLTEAAAPPPATTDSRYETVRLSVISAHLRLLPHLRSDLVSAEVLRWKDRPLAHTTLLLNWLRAEHEYARILRMLPAQTAARHTDLLPAYVDALRGTSQWQPLHTFLTSGGIDPAFSSQKILLWQAEAQFHLHTEPSQPRQTLLRIYEEAGRGEDPATTLQAAALAERYSQWDLAEKCYEALASRHPATRPAMLAKVYQMAGHQHDGPRMLHACQRLRDLQPENPAFLTQQLYLQLVLGTQLELAQQQLQDLLDTSITPTDRICLLQALAAYRTGRLPEVSRFLTPIAKPEDLSSGERSIYAFLLKAAGGDAGKAFRLVERISPVLLLPEEKLFLQRAL
ncbi:hypothetical protein [Prosthecobacter sp.]|uniref:hypothetical protein n=1 Tax=Prosthecobacter sp. TaxID=1965333 RepID=UPI003783C377